MPIFTQHPGGEGYAPGTRSYEDVLPHLAMCCPSYPSPLRPLPPSYPSSSHHTPWPLYRSYSARDNHQDLESLAARARVAEATNSLIVVTHRCQDQRLQSCYHECFHPKEFDPRMVVYHPPYYLVEGDAKDNKGFTTIDQESPPAEIRQRCKQKQSSWVGLEQVKIEGDGDDSPTTS
ncbi:unnamed protein product [Linum trigynum]|uniref:Uncharacterized protein n=1 Tax=Linum trigynum TaxID=586398 RepID=A0AAV2CX58_9ROSI